MILPQARRGSFDERDFTSERFSYGDQEPFGISIMQHAEHHAATDSTQLERT